MRKPLFILLLLLTFVRVTHAQASVVTLTVEAGFGGYFRDSEWMPVIVNAVNDGDAVTGRLVVRPETSGSGITNTYATPITLPSGARQTAFLYITARSFASEIRVELIDDTGVVVAQQSAAIHSIQPQDRLNLVVTESPVGAVDLTGVHAANFNGYQAEWRIADLPDRALDSVDLILFSDVDTGTMSTRQQQAVADWVESGGHLIATGGQNWQATAAGLADLLPLVPDASRSVSDLAPLGSWLRIDADLDAETVIATGSLRDNADVLVALEDDTPLLARRTVGSGVTEYLAADPNNAPLRGWTGLPDLWFTLITSTSPQPGWEYGFVDWESAARAAEILPGYDPLPDILPLCGFLALYIALVGPANYVILNRINRREWAWITIPAMILVFSVLSYVLGFNLRGNEATLNRLAVVRTWDDSERAQVDELVGLLSPRRAQYSLTVEDDQIMRPIPRPLQATGILTRGTQASVVVSESERFEARNFSVDASFIAGFHVSGVIDKPDISGEATTAYDVIEGQQIVRGSVRNGSDITLSDPVILARGIAYQFDEPLAPGDVATFDLVLTGENSPAPAMRSPVATSPYLSFRSASNATKQSVIDIVGPDDYSPNILRLGFTSSAEEQAKRRRQYFVSSFVDDYYQSTGRGDRVYLAGWTDDVPLATDVSGASWNSEDTTLYLVELGMVDAEAPAGSVLIAPERFTWVTTDYLGIGEATPINLQMQAGDEVALRFTPQPDAVLNDVESLVVFIDNTNVGGLRLPVYLWDWELGDWEQVQIIDEQGLVNHPARFLGPQNAVQVRVVADEIGGFLRIGRIAVSQIGTF